MPEERRIAAEHGVRQNKIIFLTNRIDFWRKSHFVLDLNPLSAYQYGRSVVPDMKVSLEYEPGPGRSNREGNPGSGIMGAVAERDRAARPMRGAAGRGGRSPG